MPLIVDHDVRRKQVAAIAARLIAARGLDGVSVREIARAAGCSTAVVSHYFHNKRELLVFVYRSAMTATVALARRRRDRGQPVDRCLEAILPLDRRRRDNWKIFFSLWGMAMGDAEMRGEQQQAGREARMLFAELLATAGTAAAPSALAPEDRARRLLIAVSGIATQATYDPDDWPPRLQRALLRQVLAALA